jgi:N-acetylmuramic acid 6-phosphate etherase
MERSPTEAVLEATREIDRWTTDEIVRVIHEEDRNAHAAVTDALPRIVDAADVLATSLAGGGTWFNVGAGTSGRIGVLDAAEVPPTFGLPPQRVQGIIAGGERALWRAVEGAEDQPERAVFELQERGLSAGDAVIAVTCNPDSALAEAAEIAISLVVGPEVIAGSTRMKGGLAQKMVLHLLSTTVMVRLGYVCGNLMWRVQPASRKLQDRAVRILMSLGGTERESAEVLLEECGGNVAEATRRARTSSG